MGLSKEELLANRAKREADAKAEREAAELQELELEERYSTELGKRGLDFEIVNTPCGVFVVRAPDFVTMKSFNSTPAEKRTDEDVVKLADTCLLFPDKASFRTVVQQHGGIAYRLVIAIKAMYEAFDAERVGKF